jgi:hypothetical protein
MTDIIHRFEDGGSISVDGATLIVCLPAEPGRLPIALAFVGEAVVGLLAGSQKAFSARPNDRRSRAAQAHEAALARVLREHDWSDQDDVCSPRRRTQRWRKKQAEKRKKVANG